MAGKRLTWDVIEPALRKLTKGEMLEMLRTAHGALPAARAVAVFGDLVDFTASGARSASNDPAGARQLLTVVKKFHGNTVAHEYYDAFDVHSKNYMEKSKGTALWIKECCQLFDKCVAVSNHGRHAEACVAMDLLFDLLATLDRDPDAIVFFADEAGSWQVGVEYERVLAAYFVSLSATAAPEYYAARVSALIKAHVSYDSEKFFRKAHRAANAEQRRALEPHQRPAKTARATWA